MLELSFAISRRALSTVGTESATKTGFKLWLEKGAYSFDPATTNEDIKLTGISLTEIGPYLSWDYERFALSSFESFINCSLARRSPKAIGWPLLKLYYSAFFGAHALMRATGKGVVRLDTPGAKNLSRILALFNPNVGISAGGFEYRLSRSLSGSFDVQMQRIPDTGGAHDQFWRQFYKFLTEVSHEVAEKNEPQASVVVAEISDIQNVLSANGLNHGTWLSSIRNQINYQHEYGVWFPYASTESKVMNGVNTRPSSSIRRDYNSGRMPLNAFSAGCEILAAINKDVASQICRRTGVTRFKRLWDRLAIN